MSENLQAVLTDEASEMASAKEGGSRQRLAAAGGILGAIAASACCILPLTLIVFGVSGAWMANLRAIAPYQVQSALKKVDGVKIVDVSLHKVLAVVTYDDGKADVAALTKATTDAGFPSALAREGS